MDWLIAYVGASIIAGLVKTVDIDMFMLHCGSLNVSPLKAAYRMLIVFFITALLWPLIINSELMDIIHMFNCNKTLKQLKERSKNGK